MSVYPNSMLLKTIFFAVVFFTTQQTGGVLILQLNGDLWAWTGSQPQVIRRTNWGYNQIPVVSPDSKMVAYKSAAQISVNVIKKSHSVGGGEIPSNLWLMDTITGDTVRIADQPLDAAIFTPNHTDKFVLRSLPTWSEDSKFLAWTQLITNNSTNIVNQPQLVIYNLEKRIEMIIVPTLWHQYGVPVPPQVQWGRSGIAVWSTTATAAGKGSEDAIVIFDTDGKLSSTIKINALYEFSWIKDGDKEYIGALAKGPPNQPLDQTQWLLIDPRSGQRFGMPGTPELYSLNRPDGLSVFVANIGAAPEWEIARPNKSVDKLGNVDDVYVFTHTLTISPDGQKIAYVQHGAAYVYGDGKTTQIAPSDVSALAWGPTGWRVRRSKIGG